MRLMSILVIGVMVPGIAAAQAVPPPLSTDNAASHMVRAAGMPLRDGALPPGTLTVRIVQGGFSGNLGGQSVQAEVLGGKVEVATTGADGRAQFAHLPVGSQIHASAVVDGERLESETFAMPAESGVRVLLVAGGGATTAPAAGDEAAPPGIVAATMFESPGGVVETASSASAPEPAATGGVAIVRIALALATALACTLFVLSRRYRLVRRGADA
jgi:hypothetical protein